jgi:hypothetical protein
MRTSHMALQVEIVVEKACRVQDQFYCDLNATGIDWAALSVPLSSTETLVAMCRNYDKLQYPQAT